MTNSTPIFAMPPEGSLCQVPTPSLDDYTPCADPAKYIMVGEPVSVIGGDPLPPVGYCMCAKHAEQIYKDKGLKRLKVGGTYTPVNDSRTSRNSPNDELIESDDTPTATDEQLKKVSKLAKEQVQLLRDIENLEQQLAGKQAALKVNMESQLPQAMSEAAGMEAFTLPGGIGVEVSKLVTAGVSAEKQPEKHKALIDYMMKTSPDLVKHRITIEFGMKDSTFFNKFMRDLAKRKRPVNAELKDSVHSGTLGKYVRECDAANKSVPEDILNVFRKTIAKVILPKPDKDKI